MHCLELIKFYDSNTSYYVEIEKWCTVVRCYAVMENDPWRSSKFLGQKCGNCDTTVRRCLELLKTKFPCCYPLMVQLIVKQTNFCILGMCRIDFLFRFG